MWAERELRRAPAGWAAALAPDMRRRGSRQVRFWDRGPLGQSDDPREGMMRWPRRFRPPSPLFERTAITHTPAKEDGRPFALVARLVCALTSWTGGANEQPRDDSGTDCNMADLLD